MHPLWTSRHLLQLLPQPALPEVSSGCSRPLACGAPTRLPGWPAGFPRKSATARSAEDFLIVAENAIPKRLGGLFETPLRWPTTCTPVSGALYPSRGRLQPPLGFLCGQQSHFPLARLRSPQRTEVAHPIARSIPASLPVARPP